MKSAEHVLIGGPALSAWPRGRFSRIRPGKGGGGGDGGAAQMEADRQARVKTAIDKINSIFNGQDEQVVEGKASAYTPGQTYYNADGSQFVAPMTTAYQPIDTASRAPNASDPEYGSYYNVKADPTMGHWETGFGDSGQFWVPNPNPGGVSALDTSAINKALQDGLFTSVKTIKGLDRQGMYDQQQQAVTDLNTRDVNRQAENAGRENRFGLARAGLSGGSADIDSNAEINRIQSEGLMKAVGLGQSAAADLRTADERTRQGLISTAQSGIDTGQVQQMALAGLDANAANAKSATSGATVGNLFGDLSNAYLQNQQLQAFKNGYAPYMKPIGSSSIRSGGSNGRVQ